MIFTHLAFCKVEHNASFNLKPYEYQVYIWAIARSMASYTSLTKLSDFIIFIKHKSAFTYLADRTYNP